VSLSFAPKSESDFYLFSFCYDFNAVTGWERDWHKVWRLSHCDFSNQFLQLIYHVLSISSQSTFFVSFSNPRLPCVAVFCENTPSVITPLCSCLYSESVCQFCSFFPWCATRRDTAPSIVCGCPLPFRLNRACPAAVSLGQVASKNNVSTLYLKCAVVVIHPDRLITQSSICQFWLSFLIFLRSLLCFRVCLCIGAGFPTLKVCRLSARNGYNTFKVRVFIPRSVQPPRQRICTEVCMSCVLSIRVMFLLIAMAISRFLSLRSCCFPLILCLSWSVFCADNFW